MTNKTLILAALACGLAGCVLSSNTATHSGSLNYQQTTKRYNGPPIPVGSVAGAGASCPQGYKVSGGGFDIDSETLALESFGPAGETDFLVAVRNISGALLEPAFKVTAICVRLT